MRVCPSGPRCTRLTRRSTFSPFLRPPSCTRGPPWTCWSRCRLCSRDGSLRQLWQAISFVIKYAITVCRWNFMFRFQIVCLDFMLIFIKVFLIYVIQCNTFIWINNDAWFSEAKFEEPKQHFTKWYFTLLGTMYSFIIAN